MKTLLLSTLALALAVASPSLVSAGGGGHGGGGHGGGHSGGFNGNHGGGNYGGHNYRNQHYYTNYGGGYLTGGNYLSIGQAYEPLHSSYIVQPGDSFYTISLKEYGTSANMQHIARFNRMPSNAALVPGQPLLLPSIASNGALRASRAPAAEGLTAPTANFAAPRTASSTTPATGAGFASSDANLPSVSVGSSLALDGIQFGDAAGSVRLKLGPVSVPVTVAEWTAASVKVQLPTVELDSATPASIDVFRADGTLVSQSKVKLTPAGDQVAQTK